MSPKREMSEVRLTSWDEFLAHVRERLLGGWVLITGDESLVPRLEQEVYPPSEGLNDGFEAFLGPGGSPVFLGRKTDRLRDLLKATDDTEWEDLFGIELHAASEPGAFLCDMASFRPGLTSSERTAWVDAVLKAARP